MRSKFKDMIFVKGRGNTHLVLQMMKKKYMI